MEINDIFPSKASKKSVIFIEVKMLKTLILNNLASNSI
jgi:hypothetical protein